jgi:hypothetical protein
MGSACGKLQQVSDAEADLQQDTQQHNACDKPATFSCQPSQTSCTEGDAHRAPKPLRQVSSEKDTSGSQSAVPTAATPDGVVMQPEQHSSQAP